jgi:hypothetical protein
MARRKPCASAPTAPSCQVLRPFYEKCLARLNANLDAPMRDELWARGRALTIDEAVALTQDLA